MKSQINVTEVRDSNNLWLQYINSCAFSSFRLGNFLYKALLIGYHYLNYKVYLAKFYWALKTEALDLSFLHQHHSPRLES